MTQYNLHAGDNLITLKTYGDNTFDSIITDPPYGIDFLGKEWDSHTGTVELYTECLRVLKPGGYLLAFSAARTYHKLAYSIELAGFEIRDQIMWIYGSGFPKASDIGKAIQKRTGEYEKKGEVVCTSPEAKEWAGWKTSLKPAHEPICMARKPFKGSAIDQVLDNGLSALNIDKSRIEYESEQDQADYKDRTNPERWKTGVGIQASFEELGQLHGRKIQKDPLSAGKVFSKWPAKVSINETFESKSDRKIQKDPLSAGKVFTGLANKHNIAQTNSEVIDKDKGTGDWVANDIGRYPSNVIGEVTEDYQKYFYCPKVSRGERHVGFGLKAESNKIGERECSTDNNQRMLDSIARRSAPTNESTGNNHPTVKPQALMSYLINLVTPPSTSTLQRKVLDPFMGSGSTGMAAVKLGHHFTGCDLDQKYIDISKTRIDAWNKQDSTFNDFFGETK